jgi:hypothetical protein
MASRRRHEEREGPRRPPATTPEGRENQLISLAVDLVEKKLIDGTASSQETVHFLKLGSSREILEQERLRLENELSAEKKKHLASAARMEELYAEAIGAMRAYQGAEEAEETFDD